MAFARQVFTVNDAAGETQFDVVFPYLQKSHVKVQVDGVYTTDYNWITDGRIELISTAPFGSIVTITRETSPSARLVDYQTGSVLSEEILDTDSLQGFYLAQEANDVKELTLAKNAQDQWEGGNRRIENVADPVNNQDVVTKGYLGPNLTAITNVSNNITAVSNVSTNLADISQVANTLDAIEEIASGDTASNINTFAAYYRHGTAAPSGVAEGAMWFDTQTDTLKIWDGQVFQPYNTSVQTEFQGLKVNADGELQWTHGTANNTFSTEDYDDWFFALSDITIEIDTDGHLIVRY